MKKLSDYNLELKKWKLPYFKKYVRGEISYKEYNPSVSDMCRTLNKLALSMLALAVGT